MLLFSQLHTPECSPKSDTEEGLWHFGSPHEFIGSRPERDSHWPGAAQGKCGDFPGRQDLGTAGTDLFSQDGLNST
jgi:hypothetical protein